MPHSNYDQQYSVLWCLRQKEKHAVFYAPNLITQTQKFSIIALIPNSGNENVITQSVNVTHPFYSLYLKLYFQYAKAIAALL